MAQTFPASLQDKFNQAGFSYAFGNSTLESKVDAGPPKKRRRYTTEIDEISGTIELEKSEFTTLETVYKTTLSGGVLTFNFNHPITQVSTEYQFTKPPTIAPSGCNYFRVNFTWSEVI